MGQSRQQKSDGRAFEIMVGLTPNAGPAGDPPEPEPTPPVVAHSRAASPVVAQDPPQVIDKGALPLPPHPSQFDWSSLPPPRSYPSPTPPRPRVPLAGAIVVLLWLLAFAAVVALGVIRLRYWEG